MRASATLEGRCDAHSIVRYYGIKSRIRRREALIFRNGVVDLIAPGFNAALDALDVFESLLA